MHNERLADPLDPIKRKLSPLTSKKVKTDTDHEQIGHLEWLAGLYYDPEAGPYLPGENLEKCLTEGARFTRDGKKIERGLMITDDVIRLRYPGPRDLDSLWKEVNPELSSEELGDYRPYRFRKTVVVARARTIRVRPRFPIWGIEAHGQYSEEQLDLDTLQQAVEAAGKFVGLGDWRPRYGRFTGKVTLLEDEPAMLATADNKDWLALEFGENAFS